jgi:hypothetical protein
MKKHVWTMLARLQLGKFLMVAICLSALLGMVPPPAQGQVVNSTQNPAVLGFHNDWLLMVRGMRMGATGTRLAWNCRRKNLFVT